MTSFEFGNVVLLPFPFTDQSGIKKRPAVVISSVRYQQERPDLIVLAITSQVREVARLGEVAVSKWQAAGLLKPSVLKPVITTIQRNIVIKSLGRLAPEDLDSLQQILSEIIGTR